MNLLSLLKAEREAPRRYVHVTTQGTNLTQSGQRLAVRKDQERLLEIPVLHLRGILLYGDVRASTGALRLCAAEGVAVTFLSRTGRLRARLAPAQDYSAKLRVLQYQRSQDANFCLRWSQGIVRAKLLSALAHLEAKERGHQEAPKRTARQLRQTLEKLGATRSLDELRGLEGTAAASYFAALRGWVPDEVGFPGRRRESPDLVNVLLNLGYTLLYREMEGLASGAGLEPALGFYHSLDAGRASLACDVQEEFRHNFVDRLVLTLVNRRQIQPEKHLQAAGSSAPRLTAEALSVFLTAYEKAASLQRPDFLRQLERLVRSIEVSEPYSSHWEP
jgi:CRISPR-associated protein Cas1